ncbi:hypothetical protein Q4577_08740 [Marinovum sp. 2_MG-2023]|uniref:hypothetical protein n=1 Tax=unclassified Marinovum TaxID=2647166 RepID=UPI0026E1AC40|nr:MULTISPECIES: hypothetical protein [unclassified Marinovum]MDO6730103.1 hypothetical protein [Marinovum sp. 2_MG-2023]MDO6779917.1 hypothetical protein [Marinovum sp. 1_MG-2023]
MSNINKTDAVHLMLAGLVAELSFEAYAWLVSPALFGVQLEPANLVIGLTGMATGTQLPYAAAFAIHFLIGIFGFAAAVWLVKRGTGLGHATAGLITGVGLWFVAQGMLAPLMGRSFMMGFGAYTQSSFVGHVGMTLIVAIVWRWLATRRSAQPQPI